MLSNNFLNYISTCNSLSSFLVFILLSFHFSISLFSFCPELNRSFFPPKQRVLSLFSLLSCPHYSPIIPVLRPCRFLSFPSHILAACCLSSSCNINFPKISLRFISLFQKTYVVSAEVLIIWHVHYSNSFLSTLLSSL